jgi:hypothetical protein
MHTPDYDMTVSVANRTNLLATAELAKHLFNRQIRLARPTSRAAQAVSFSMLSEQHLFLS